MEADSNSSFKEHLEPTRMPRSARLLAAQFKEEEPEYAAYANGRIGNRPQLTLILRKASGSAKGMTYTHLLSVDSDDPATGFDLRFTSQLISIRGKNLERLFRLVCEQKVAEIVEAGRGDVLNATGDAAVVEQLDWLVEARQRSQQQG